ncbi:unnamed protein product [marine sediment metagenome]|uniref:Uncharacterized protein n=1 Tax=marine sediment metagenome TaxID=412755 RepID=X1GLU2_9ZZZZ
MIAEDYGREQSAKLRFALDANTERVQHQEIVSRVLMLGGPGPIVIFQFALRDA